MTSDILTYFLTFVINADFKTFQPIKHNFELRVLHDFSPSLISIHKVSLYLQLFSSSSCENTENMYIY